MGVVYSLAEALNLAWGVATDSAGATLRDRVQGRLFRREVIRLAADELFLSTNIDRKVISAFFKDDLCAEFAQSPIGQPPNSSAYRNLETALRVSGIEQSEVSHAFLTAYRKTSLEQADPIQRLIYEGVTELASQRTSQHQFVDVHATDVQSYLRSLVSHLRRDLWISEFMTKAPDIVHVQQPLRIRILKKDRRDRQPGSRELRDSLPDWAQAESLLSLEAIVKYCERAVLVGLPGSGKTWIARRCAIESASDALLELETGTPWDEVEVPVFSTVSGYLESLAHSLSPRDAVAQACLSRIGGLTSNGTPAIAFAEWIAKPTTPLLVVLDGLDEAPNCNFDVLAALCTEPKVRLVATTRPAAWAGQVPLDQMREDHVLGQIQPLDYPLEVHQIVDRVLAPASAANLKSRIAASGSLGALTSIPLALFWLCVLEEGAPDWTDGEAADPTSLTDLYSRLLDALSSNRWRGGMTRSGELSLDVLRGAAWASAVDHSSSGLSDWPRDFALDLSEEKLSDSANAAIDALAPVTSRPRPWEPVRRKFVHESLREHLVADYVSRLPIAVAHEAIAKHMVFDSQWEYIGPAAVGMHPDGASLLAQLLDNDSLNGVGYVFNGENELAAEKRSFVARVLELSPRWYDTRQAAHRQLKGIALDRDGMKALENAREAWLDYSSSTDGLLRGQQVGERDSNSAHRAQANEVRLSTIDEITEDLLSEAGESRDLGLFIDWETGEGWSERDERLSFMCEALQIQVDRLTSYTEAKTPKLEHRAHLVELASEVLDYIDQYQGFWWMEGPTYTAAMLLVMRRCEAPHNVIMSGLERLSADLSTSEVFQADASIVEDDWDVSHRIVNEILDVCQTREQKAFACTMFVNRLCKGTYYDWMGHALAAGIAELGATSEEIARSFDHLVAQVRQADPSKEWLFIPTANAAVILFDRRPNAGLLADLRLPYSGLATIFAERLATSLRKHSTYEQWRQRVCEVGRLISAS